METIKFIYERENEDEYQNEYGSDFVQLLPVGAIVTVYREPSQPDGYFVAKSSTKLSNEVHVFGNGGWVDSYDMVENRLEDMNSDETLSLEMLLNDLNIG